MMKKMYTIGCFVGKCTTKFVCLGFFVLLFFVQDGFGQLSITIANTPVTQNFDGLPSTGTALAQSGGIFSAGWSFLEGGSNANATYDASTGSANAGNTYSFGVAGTNALSDRAFGILQSGSLTSILGFKFTNNTGSTITSLIIGYTGEVWRRSASADALTFSYQSGNVALTASGYTTVASLGFTTPVTGTATNLDGNAAANRTVISAVTITGLSIANGTTYTLRWVDASGASSAGMAIDDFTITLVSTSAPTVTTIAASPITTTEATLNGTVSSNGAATTVTFNYGTTTSYGTNATAAQSPLASNASGTSVTAAISSLSVNTLYNFRVSGNNSQGTTDGSNLTFYTLANTPNAPSVNNPTASTLDVAIGGSDGNPSATEYAIQETGSSNYVQANGSLGASAVWQTASTWGTKTITGLAASTSYTFRVKARNGANTETAFGSTANNTTSAAATPNLGVTGTTAHGSVCPNVSAYPITYTITNTGSTASNVVVSSNDPQFVVSGLSSTTIPASGTATYNVTFTPTSAGAKTATISVFYNTNTLATTSSLTGTGTTPVTATVTSSAATAVVNTTATLNGNVTALGVCPATTEKGFVYSLTSTNNNPQNGGTGVTKRTVAGLTTGAYILDLTGLTPNTSYSFNSYVYDGTTYTYGTTQTFTTLQVASKLAFGIAPPATGSVGTNLTTFTVQAQRPDNSIDAEYMANIVITKATGSGNISGTTTVAASAGTATFSAVQFDAADTYTITATSGGLATITSNPINISIAATVVNFDDNAKWTAGSVALTSYANNHTYVDGVFSATGGGLIRNTTASQDGVTGAFGNYSCRLENASNVDWRITIASGGVGDFSVKIRRWDDSPSPDFALEYSINGGSNWTSVATINNASLNNSSNWVTFNGTINNANNNILIRLKANGTTERILVDDFSWFGYTNPPCAAPTADATNLNLTPISPTQINGSFTAASPAPTGYLVVRYSNDATSVSLPTNATTYTVGNTIGSAGVNQGTVVAFGTSTNFSATSLSASTTYKFYIYPYNNTNCIDGPVYKTNSPLNNTATTQAPTPEINVVGNAITIVDGDNTPTTADHTDFGSVGLGSSFTRTFTIQNTGTATLNISGSTPFVTISGTNTADFAVTTPPSNTIVAGGSTTFVVTFTPSAIGARNAIITINSDDADEAVYNFDIAGTATTSALSDIVSTYTASDYNQNIDYTLYQSATISSTANSIRVFRFDIRDGGGTVDADNLPTILSNITFNVTNIANIRTAALFDGNTLINASPTINEGAGTIGFSGLSYSTADGATNTLSLRITFATNVVDKSQMQFSIASANVGVAGSNTSSLFASFSTVQSLITNNINRVVVMADRLRFVTQPSGSTAGVNLTAFTIAAVDALGSIDVDATNAVTLTTNGTGMSSGSPYTLVDGTLSISNVQFSSGNTGITLTITTTGLSFDNDDLSNTFNIETVAVNSYRTTSGGAWATATWERFVSGAWTTVSAPVTGVTDEVYIRNAITSGSFTPAKVIVQSGGVLTISGSSTISTSLLVQTGGTLQVNAALTLNVSSTFTVDSAGVVNINSASISGTSSIWGGTENFNKNSTVNIQNWNHNVSSSNRRLIQNPSIISTNANGYYFGNLTISGSPTEIFVMVDGNQTINLAEGNFTVATTGGSNVAFTNAAANVTIGGNLIVTANTFSFAASTSGNSVSTVLGNILATGGTINLNQGSSASASSTIHLKGNLNIANGAALSSSDEGCAIFFSGTTTQTLSIAGTLNTNVTFDVDNGATVQLINQNLSLANASNSFDVLTGGTLDFNGFDITGLGAFTTASGATLKITSANGVNATGNNTGNVQTNSRTFSQSTNFHYVGSASPQSTGTAMTSGSTAKQILIDKTNATDIVNLTQSTGTSSLLQINNGILVETASANITGSGALTMNGGTYRTAVLSTTLPQLTGAYTFSSSSTLQLNGAGAQVLRGGRDYTNLTFSNSGTKTLTSAISNINGTVTIQDAAIVNTENNTFGGATTNLTMTGTARLINAGTTTRPTISGTYNLASTTTIEFNNSLTTTQPIRASGVTYANIDVSGTSVGITTSTASITMQSGTTFTVKNGAIFKNKNINGFSGGANTAIGNTNNPNIVLETGSTVEYNGVAADNPSTAAQTITPINYSNLLISSDRGNATVTLPSSTIGIGNIFSTTATNVNYSTASNTINFNGSVDQTIPVFPYHHLATGGTGTKSIADNLTLNGGLSVGENTSLQASNYIITPAAANSVTITGTFITSNVNGFSGAANTAINSLNNPGFNLTNGTIVYNAAVEQNVTPRNDYHHVTIRNNSTKLLLGNAVFNGSLNLEDGVFNISGQTVTFQNGNTPLLRTNGTITTNGLTNLVFGTMGNTGGNAFTIPNNLFTNATPTLANFTINRSNSLTLNNQFFNLIRKLDLQSGNLILPNNYIFTLKSTSILNTALVAPVGGTIAYGTGAAFMVERFIPKDITKNSGNGIRAFRDISPGLMPDADIFSTWQEGGINNNGFGTQITGKVGTPGTVDAITGLDLTTSGNPSLYSFNVSLSNGVPSWDNGFRKTKDTIASPFKGYRISIRGNRQNNLGINGTGLNNEVVLRNKGKLVTGTVTFTKDGVTATNDMSTTAVRLASSTTTSFTMVGNPYVSPLDFAKMMNNSVNSGIQKSCWIFDPNIGTAGAYVTYNSIVESNSNDSSQVNKYIQPGQAFFIRNNGTTSPVLEIREEDKAVDSVDNLRGVFSEGTVQPLHKIKFTLLKNVSNVFANMDGALLCFKNGFTNARGAEDALKFENTGENIAIANNGNYSIEGKAIPTVSDSTVVRIWKMESAAAYQLKIDLTGVSINGLQPILKDRFTKTQTVLPINTVYNYSFTTSADTNSFNNRFTIVYTNTTPLPVAFISLKASQLNANNIIDWKVTESNIQHYTVEYTPQLSSAFSSIATINSNGSGTYQYTHVGATNNGGYYRIKATDYAGAIKYSSVVAIAVQGNNATIQVYPNPILLSNGLKLAFNAITTDNYTVQLVDNAGKLVYQTNVQHQTGQAVYTLPLPSSISAGNYQLKVIGKQIQHQQAIIIHP